MKSLELFSGVGGLAKGLELSGVEHVALLEINKDACRSLSQNFPEIEIINQDVRDVDFSRHQGLELLSGGPPCQPFSLGGKARGNSDRRDMFPYAIKGIRSIVPSAFIFENVKGLLRQSFREYFDYIILQLSYPEVELIVGESWTGHLSRLRSIRSSSDYAGLRYDVKFKLLNAADYGVPQRRERVFIVGVRADLGVQWRFPPPTHSRERLLWEKYITKDYWARHSMPCQDPDLKVSRQVERLRNKYGFFEPERQAWRTVRDALAGIPEPDGGTWQLDHQLREGAKSYPGHTGSYIDEPSKTLKAGDHGVPGGENMVRFEDGSVRYFSVFEAKRIQTFPDSYQISGSWTEAMRQLGNAVPVELARVLGTELIGTLMPVDAVV